MNDVLHMHSILCYTGSLMPQTSKGSSPGFSVKGWSSALGHGLAHLQHKIDKLIDLGFKRVGESAQSSVLNEKNDRKPLNAVKGLTKSGLSFIGTLGQAYYERYEELKAKK